MLSLKNLIQTGAFSVLIQALTLGQSILIARDLGAVGRGELVGIIALPQLLAIIVNMGTKSHLALSASMESKEDDLYRSPIYPLSILTGSVGVGMFYLYHSLNASLNSTILIAGIYIVLNNLSVNLISQIQGRGQLKLFNYCRSIISILYFFSIVTLSLLRIVNIKTVVYSWVGTEILALITLVYIFQEPLKLSDWKFSETISHLKKSAKFTLIDLYSTGNSHLEKVLFVTFISDKFIIGLIAVSQSVSSINSFMGSSLSQLVYMDTLKQNESTDKIKKIFKSISIIILISTVFLFFCGNYIIRTVYSQEFAVALPLVLLMSFAGLFSLRWIVYEQIFRAYNKPELTVLPKIFGTLILVSGLYVIRFLKYDELIEIGVVYIVYQAVLSFTIKLKLNEAKNSNSYRANRGKTPIQDS